MGPDHLCSEEWMGAILEKSMKMDEFITLVHKVPTTGDVDDSRTLVRAVALVVALYPPHWGLGLARAIFNGDGRRWLQFKDMKCMHNFTTELRF